MYRFITPEVDVLCHKLYVRDRNFSCALLCCHFELVYQQYCVSACEKKSFVKKHAGKTTSSCLAADQSEISKLLREREQAIVSFLHLSGKEVKQHI